MYLELPFFVALCVYLTAGVAHASKHPPVTVSAESLLAHVIKVDREECVQRLFCAIGSDDNSFGFFGSSVASWFGYYSNITRTSNSDSDQLDPRSFFYLPYPLPKPLQYPFFPNPFQPFFPFPVRPVPNPPATTTRRPVTTTPAVTTTSRRPVTTPPAVTTTSRRPVTTTPAVTTTSRRPVTTTPVVTTTSRRPVTTTPAVTTTSGRPVTTTPAVTTTPRRPVTTTPAVTTTPRRPVTTTLAVTTTPRRSVTTTPAVPTTPRRPVVTPPAPPTTQRSVRPPAPVSPGFRSLDSNPHNYQWDVLSAMSVLGDLSSKWHLITTAGFDSEPADHRVADEHPAFDVMAAAFLKGLNNGSCRDSFSTCSLDIDEVSNLLTQSS